MNILITGVAGFLGSHLSEKLAEKFYKDGQNIFLFYKDIKKKKIIKKKFKKKKKKKNIF